MSDTQSDISINISELFLSDDGHDSGYESDSGNPTALPVPTANAATSLQPWATQGLERFLSVEALYDGELYQDSVEFQPLKDQDSWIEVISLQADKNQKVRKCQEVFGLPTDMNLGLLAQALEVSENGTHRRLEKLGDSTQQHIFDNIAEEATNCSRSTYRSAEPCVGLGIVLTDCV